MNELPLLNEENEMSSQNHSLIQARLAAWLTLDDRFNAATELSLDISQVDLAQFKLKSERDLRPDVCVYYARDFDIIDPAEHRDNIKVSQMPLLAVEILSPMLQGTEDIFAKFRAYFTLGIKSCWLVDPTLQTITVCASPRTTELNVYKVTDQEVIDNVVDIHLPLSKIFKKKLITTGPTQ